MDEGFSKDLSELMQFPSEGIFSVCRCELF